MQRFVSVPNLFNGVKPAVSGLYILGNWDVSLFDRAVAVIGSRRMTQYGQKVVELLVPQLVEDGWTIVSGFMYGVDKLAHQIAVSVGGKTVAVLGWGIGEQLEQEDRHLAERIVASGGLLVSEWENQKGALWTFPLRNRIVAALCQRVYVVEAGEKSGSLITVELARKMGKEIWAVPGPVTSKVSLGTNRLIAEGVAKMWIGESKVHQTSNIGSINNTDIYSLLQNEPLSIDDLSRLLGKKIDILSYELMQLQLQGVIEERAGKYWIV